MMNEKRKVKLVSMIDKSQAGLDSVMPVFNTLYKAYKALLDDEVITYLDTVGKSRIPYYMIMNKLQKVNASFVEAYFTNKQFAKISEKPSLKGTYFNPLLNAFMPFSRGKFDGMTIEAIKALQNAVDYYTTEDDNSILYHALTAAFEDIQIYGTSVIKVDWNEGLYVERINLKDIKFDVEAETQNKLKYVVHDIYLTKEEILEYRDSGIFDKDVDYSKIRSTDDNNGAKTNSPEDFIRFKLQEVYELSKGKWTVTTMYNKTLILRDSINLPFGLPFIIGKIKNQKNKPDGTEDGLTVKIYGDSMAAPLVPIQREMTILRNQQIDIATAPPKFITDASINPFDLLNRNMPIIKGKASDVHEIPKTSMRESNFNVDKLEVEAQDIIGVVDYGANGGKQMNKTATGMSILTSESSKILQHLLRGNNETNIKPLFRKITQLVWAYGKADFFYGVDRTQKLEYQVGVDVGLGATNKESQLNSKLLAYGKMIESAQLNPIPEIMMPKLEKADKFLYKEIFPLMGIENFEEYYNDENRENGNLTDNRSMERTNGEAGGFEEGFNQQEYA